MEVSEKDRVKVNKRNKDNSPEELKNLSKEKLIERIIQLNAHNKQLKNILEKKINPKGSIKERKAGRKFDFSKCYKRHILLKFCYLGWDMQGYVVQEDTIDTVEHNIFEALKRVCLIEQLENYHRCGRTDKGVSSFEQVMSITLRSKIEPEKQLTKEGVEGEIGYCNLLNKVLPQNIRVISWMPLINPTFSARFDCYEREYRYFFPKGNLDIVAMQEACKYLIGSHDFRNLCKMDVGNGVVTFIRRMKNVEIDLQAKNCDGNSGYDMYVLHIVGNAFLWHQIRCIVAILFLIGDKKEDPELIKELLDVEKNSQKPQYSLASEIPLNLFFTYFREDKAKNDTEICIEMANKWFFEQTSLKEVIQSLQEQWCIQNVKSTMIYEMTKHLETEYQNHFPEDPAVQYQPSILNRDTNRRQYKRLMTRQKCSGLEDRIVHFAKKQRITVQSPVKMETEGDEKQSAENST